MTNNISTPSNPVGRFMVAVGAVILNENGQVLLLKRHQSLDWHPGEWEIPYGRLAQHEDARDALSREIKEEVGLTVSPMQPLTIWHIYRGQVETAENELIGITFLCQVNNGEVIISDEHEEYRWVTPNEALQLIKVQGIKKDIEALINSK